MFERVYPPKRPSRPPIPGSVVASMTLHLVLIGLGGLSLPVYVSQQLTEGIVFFAPLPVRAAKPATERVTYVNVPGGGGETSAGATNVMEDGPPAPLGQGGSDVAEGQGVSGVAVPAELPQIDMDSVYFPDEVDNPAAYDPRSAAPTYPDSLQSAGIEGSVTTQFIVDTTGRAADSSLVIIGATHPRFTQSVRDALPRMLFRPAEISGVKIRQLVQQTFSFRLPSQRRASGDSASPKVRPSVIPPGEMSFADRGS